MDHLRIKIAGKVLPYRDLKDNPQVHHAIFEAAKLHQDRPRCLCSATRPELYIAKRKWHYLARMPGTGHLHDPDCSFYETLITDSGLSGYDGAFQQIDGVFDVKLGFSLTRHRAAKPPGQAAEPAHKPSEKRGAAGLLGLLHFIWEKSKNNSWFPYLRGKPVKTRLWGSTAWHLTHAIESIYKGKTPLSSVLYVIPPFDKDRAAEIEAGWTKHVEPILASATKHAVKAEEPQVFRMVLGEVGSIEATEYGYAMTMRQTSRKFFFSNDLHAKLLRSYASAMKVDRDGPTRTICIGILAGTEKGYVNLVDGALMRVSRDYLPVDSSYEVELANKLIGEGRRFEKPLRYECTDMTLPDFILLDAETPRLPMEIYGMSGHDSYDKRKAEKRRHYAATGEKFWEWEPSRAAIIPPIPDKKLRKIEASED